MKAIAKWLKVAHSSWAGDNMEVGFFSGAAKGAHGRNVREELGSLVP